MGKPRSPRRRHHRGVRARSNADERETHQRKELRQRGGPCVRCRRRRGRGGCKRQATEQHITLSAHCRLRGDRRRRSRSSTSEPAAATTAADVGTDKPGTAAAAAAATAADVDTDKSGAAAAAAAAPTTPIPATTDVHAETSTATGAGPGAKLVWRHREENR